MPEIDRDETNNNRWWLTPEEAEAAEIRSWELGKYLARHLKPRQPPPPDPTPTEPAREPYHFLTIRSASARPNGSGRSIA